MATRLRKPTPVGKKVNLLPLEHDTQCAYFDWVRLLEGQDERFKSIFAIPNGGHRSVRTGVKMKMEGQRKGVWDIFVAVPVSPFAGLWMELKRKPNKLTDEQVLFGNTMRQHGYATAVCYSAEELIAVTKNYLGAR